MTNLTVDEFLGDDSFDQPSEAPMAQTERRIQTQPAQRSVGPSIQPGPDSLGPVLLGLFPCDNVLDGTHRPCLSFVGVRFQFTFADFPAVLANQLVAALWRLPVGEYALEVGLLDFAEELLVSSREDVTLERPTVYVSTHRLVDVPLDQPGIYRLAARCNGQLITMQPIGVEQRR